MPVRRNIPEGFSRILEKLIPKTRNGTKIIQIAEIPRTLSGKIVELAVRNVIHGRPVRNQDALANPEALALYEDLEELRTP